MHIQVREGRFAWISTQKSSRERCWILTFPLKSWLLKEFVTAILLVAFLLSFNVKKYQLINFHIAYPLLTYFHLFKWLVSVPVVVNEHWSAYRNNFGAKKELPRVKRIFKYQKKWITVSQSLANDIVTFSGQSNLQMFILPNVLSSAFQEQSVSIKSSSPPYRFLMVGCWQPPKLPLVVLRAIARINPSQRRFKLRIAGYGLFEESIKKEIVQLNLSDCVEYIGKLSYHSVAEELSKADYFLHASEYETFSVVCLEALWQGVPVIASRVGGIPEFVGESNGILVEINSEMSWQQAIENVPYRFDSELIRKTTRDLFSHRTVGQKYFDICKLVRQYSK